jgi:hypothetical protein
VREQASPGKTLHCRNDGRAVRQFGRVGLIERFWDAAGIKIARVRVDELAVPVSVVCSRTHPSGADGFGRPDNDNRFGLIKMPVDFVAEIGRQQAGIPPDGEALALEVLRQ